MASANQTARFGIALDADETVDAAAEAKAALEELRASIKGDTDEIGQMQRALKNLKGATVVNVDQVKRLTDALTTKKAAVADAQSKFIALGGSFRTAAKNAGSGESAFSKMQSRIGELEGKLKGGADAAKKNAESFDEFAKVATKLPGPLGNVVGKLGELKSLITSSGFARFAIIAGMFALIAASVAAGAALTKYAIGQADARRSELLRIEGLTKLRNWYGIAAGNAKEMQAAIDKVAASTPTSREKITQYSDELYKMHLRGDALTETLEAMSIKASVQGDAAAHAFAGWAAGANLTGQSVKRLSDNVKARLGGIAAKQMESLTVQAEKQQEAFDALFNRVNVDPYVKAKKGVSDLLSQTTNSGKALQTMVTHITQPFVDMATRAQPYIKRFFQGMIIAALQLDIVYQRLRIKFKETFGSGVKTNGIDKMRVAVMAGYTAVSLLIGVLAIAAGEMAIFAAPVLLAAAAIWGLFEIVDQLYALWKEIDWSELGSAIGDGIVNGLKDDATLIKKAVGGLADDALSGFKSALGIHSPSTVFAKLGVAIPEGVGVGVEAGAPKAQAAVDNMIGMPRISSGAADSGGAPSGNPSAPRGGPTTVNVNVGDINIAAGGSKQSDITQSLRDEVASIFEGVAIQLGAMLPGGA